MGQAVAVRNSTFPAASPAAVWTARWLSAAEPVWPAARLPARTGAAVGGSSRRPGAAVRGPPDRRPVRRHRCLPARIPLPRIRQHPCHRPVFGSADVCLLRRVRSHSGLVAGQEAAGPVRPRSGRSAEADPAAVGDPELLHAALDHPVARRTAGARRLHRHRGHHQQQPDQAGQARRTGRRDAGGQGLTCAVRPPGPAAAPRSGRSRTGSSP